MNPTSDPAGTGTPDDWLRHADSDLRIAQLARQDPDVLPNQAAFHAQQAVEKAIKAVLVRRNVEFPRTHDLGSLIELVQETGLLWPFPADQVESLTPFAVQTRYPGSVLQISLAAVDAAISTAEEVLAWAKSQVGGEHE